MKIAVTGKGGVGKTTFAAILARLYAEENRPVLAADVDPDANLGLALGSPEEVFLSGVLDEVFHVRVGRMHTEEGWQYYCSPLSR